MSDPNQATLVATAYLALDGALRALNDAARDKPRANTTVTKVTAQEHFAACAATVVQCFNAIPGDGLPPIDADGFTALWEHQG